ncbi:DUF1652 domain-containing protein [Pseudomonas sp. NFXW11]|uniref:DUF1652 domain-containing protein n=1 Tax=Pseudomonas sp. NFXW11 TaxID=2819531 RepID=UPI003CEE6020
MISLAQLRACIEQRLAPLACNFVSAGDGTLTLRVFEPESGRVDLVVTGLNARALHSEADVLKMLDELLYELASNSLQKA